jgi:signal transduction histidine kinase
VNTSQTLVFDELNVEVELNEQAINNWLAERSQDLVVIVNSPADIAQAQQVLADANQAAAYEALLKRLQVETGSADHFAEIFLINREGQVILTTNQDNLGKFHRNQNYFQEGLVETAISSPFYNLASEQNEIVITTPVKDNSGGVIGVLAGRLNLSDLAQIILNRSASTQTGETYLVSKNNRFLTEPRFPPNSQAARSEGIERALTPGLNRDGQGNYANYNGVSVVGAYRWLPELEAVLISERAESEAFAGVRQLIWVGSGVTVIALIIATISALFITSRLVRPISVLTGAATAIAEGDINQTVAVNVRNEIGLLAEAFNKMTGRLRDVIGTLEERVEQRTQALQTTAEISRQTTTLVNRDELLHYVIDRIQTEFDFYHAHIYLVEAETGELVIAEGSGSVGQQLKARGHRLRIGQGIVGTVARTGEAVLANNVDQIPHFVRNVLLPETNSELAVPLRKGNRVLGVLDIQSEQVDRFTTQDLSLLQSIADQAAIALDNARLLEETRTALREVERLNRQLTRQAWGEFSQELQARAYRFSHGVSSPVAENADAWLPSMKQAATAKQLVRQTNPGNGEKPGAGLAVPLTLRGEVIGVLGIKREQTPDWADEEVAAVEAIADQLSRALENARLSKEQEKIIEQLKEVDRLKSEFLTSMSHELRTPLNSIIGFADVLLQGIDGELNDMATNDIRLIYSSGQHLLALINDILDLSKIEAGKMELVRESIDINDTIKDVLAASTSLVKDKPVEILVDSTLGLPPVYADKLRLSQVLLNLVSNAAKFTHEGSITIKAELDEQSPDRMRIAIVDTGIGIPKDKLDTIFDRFRQADSSTTRQYGGTGLGLAISRNLAQMHGGELKVKSEVGVGSEFYFTIPLAQSVALEN